MIIPSVDLINGKVVRLYQGKYNQKISYNIDPLSCIKSYETAGAQFLHLVDLDGAKNPANRQILLLKKLIDNTSIKMQIGGGIRTRKDIIELIDAGASRVVIGSIAIKKPNLVKKWFMEFGPKVIVLSIDININHSNHKKIMINGWQKETNITLEEIIEKFFYLGLKYILCTDITRDGTLQGSNIKLYQEISKLFPTISIQASGGVSSLNDIILLRNNGASHIIIGRAILEKKFTVSEAIKCWQKG